MHNVTKSYILLIINIIINFMSVNVILLNLSFMHSNTFVSEIHLLNIKKYCINISIFHMSFGLINVIAEVLIKTNEIIKNKN